MNTEAIDVFAEYLNSIDPLEMAGEATSARLKLLAPIVHQLNFAVASLGGRGIETNQHNVDGARSGAAWFASILGISERAAALQIGAVNLMDLNPDVGDAVKSGSLSFEKAEVVVRAAKSRVSMTEELMAHARSDSFESLKRRARDLNAKVESPEDRNVRLRSSQYINVDEDDDGMLNGRFRLLPGELMPFLARWRAREAAAIKASDGALPRSAVAAEAFTAMLCESGGSSSAVLNIHVDLDWQDGEYVSPETAELAGVGIVPISILNSLGEHPAVRLLLSKRNKLLWYSESTYKAAGELPDYIKRAVKAHQHDQCAGESCVGPIDEIDHGLARTNGGKNDFANLQGLCKPDHDAKTKKDAPWTAGGIYGKPRQPRQTGPPEADAA